MADDGWRSALRRRVLSALSLESAPLDLRIVGRTVLYACVVGVGAGLVGAAFFGGLEFVQHFLLERLAGYQPLRAAGESLGIDSGPHVFRPWVLIFLPALGALAGGFISRLAPETMGGGGDAMIETFHNHNGIFRKRVLWVKALASMLTLGTGGSGGREGPTMQIGGAIGSLASRLLRVSPREARILMIAGVAAGMSAVFRTPLGAALLAVEVLYRDDFETDALVPAVLASVVAYSVVISIYGESTLFAHAPRYPFVTAHLLLYALLAILVSLVAVMFIGTLRAVQRLSAKLPIPVWTRPGVGGLLLGLFGVPIVILVGNHVGTPGQGLGILGGGYGAVQRAITGADWLRGNWQDVELLLLLCGAKLLAASLTVGSGGSAGDFAPSLVIGGLFGGAFGRGAALLFPHAGIDPGAFALVGMGTFYGGIAHVPLSALVMVCELAGSYDLLVPLMLAEGIAFVALRRASLYHAQLATKRESPVHRDEHLVTLHEVPVKSVMTTGRTFASFHPGTPASKVLEAVSEASWQDAFPVLDEGGRVKGVIRLDTVLVVAGSRDVEAWALATDIMQPALTVRETDPLRTAIDLMLRQGARELIVTDESGRIVGFIDEADVTREYLAGKGSAPAS